MTKDAERKEVVCASAKKEAVLEVEFLATSYPKEVLDNKIKALSDKTIVCEGCGNEENKYHNVLFGPMLVHKMTTMCKDTVTQGKNIADIQVTAEMVDEYIFLLCFYCFQKVGKYDTQYCYDMPKCMM